MYMSIRYIIHMSGYKAVHAGGSAMSNQNKYSPKEKTSCDI